MEEAFTRANEPEQLDRIFFPPCPLSRPAKACEGSSSTRVQANKPTGENRATLVNDIDCLDE